MLFGFLVLMLGLSVWVARRTEGGEDFLLAGRGLRTPLLLGTTLATLVGTGSSLGAVGFAYSSGWAGLLYGIGGAAGVFGLLWLFADARDHGFWTFPEEISFYYGANAALKNVVAVVLFVAEIGWPPTPCRGPSCSSASPCSRSSLSGRQGACEVSPRTFPTTSTPSWGWGRWASSRPRPSPSS